MTELEPWTAVSISWYYKKIMINLYIPFCSWREHSFYVKAVKVATKLPSINMFIIFSIKIFHWKLEMCLLSLLYDTTRICNAFSTAHVGLPPDTWLQMAWRNVQCSCWGLIRLIYWQSDTASALKPNKHPYQFTSQCLRELLTWIVISYVRSVAYTHTRTSTRTHTHIPCKKLYFICITYALWLMEHATPVAMKFHEVRRRIRKQATGAADQGTQQESLLTAEVRCACLTGRGCSPGIRQCKQQYKWLPHSLYSVCSSRPCPAVTLPISLHLTSGVSECPPNNLQISTLQTLTDNCYELRSYLTFPHLDTLTPSLQ